MQMLVILTFFVLYSTFSVSLSLLIKSQNFKNNDLSISSIKTELNPSEFSNFREARRSVVDGGFFTLVSFENFPCNASSGDVGLCYSARECTNLGGTQSGRCAGNYGVCCIVFRFKNPINNESRISAVSLVTATCGATVSLNNTYFVNPGYPSTASGPLTCTLSFTKIAGATELYLEYTTFSILGPTNGACTNDSFSISVLGGTTTSSIPVLCGTNIGNMEYIDISSATGPLRLSFTLSSASNTALWKIRLVQFKPGDFCAAPSGCNEYYRTASGTIQSYNFNSGQGQLLNNYCTRICFQAQAGYCNLLLTENTFMLRGTSPSTCTDDYLLINGLRFCGDTLNNGMVVVNQTTTGNGIQILFCSGSNHPDMDIGYNLTYNLLPCNTTTTG